MKYYLLNIDDYFKRFFEITKETETYLEAWEILENEVWEQYRISKYSTYESFKVVKHRYQNRINKT